MHRRPSSSRRVHSLAWTLTSVVLLSSCDTVVLSMVEISEVEVVPRSITLTEGGSETASAIVRERSGARLPGASVRWTVDDPDVATVSSDGVVEARRPGTTRVRAWSEGVSGAAELIVLSDGDADDEGDGDEEDEGEGDDDDDDDDDDGDDDDDDDDDDGRRGRGGRGRG
jgi:hypothetical protein